ncbi:MAG: single-stranded-DNA-specific exonuclease RecJ [Paludibacteraceae bacterium]|nr:single-stranded-DNA-specific exonuclease RecJ [Paludibacteraceae bacterium]
MSNWIWKKKVLTDRQIIIQQDLVKNLLISPLLAKLYVERNLTTQDEINSFLQPKQSSLHDPFLYKDMDKAVERLNKAITSQENILIYGDYDVDGTTSVALVYRYLSKYYNKLFFYVPDRDTEGYGISIQGVDFAFEKKCTLVIALDCGIKDFEAIDYGNIKSIDFIVCDHHNPGDSLPNAIAVLDAKREDNTYPYNELSGCGVGFKFMQAFAIKNDFPQETLLPLLDVLAMSIASDIVPLTGENRLLIQMGLQRINTEPSIGVAAMLESCELTIGKITISDLVYKIGPRINASGRIDTADEAVKLLISSDKTEAKKHCDIIESLNKQRRDLDRQTTEQALAQLDLDPTTPTKAANVVYSPNWAKGVVGIVASRIIEKHYKPTIVLTDSNGLISGSARSVSDFDLYSAIKACADDLESFGGHDFAAGLTLKSENLKKFKQDFEHIVAQTITQEQKTPLIEYDEEISFADITRDFFNIIQSLEPYGQDNPQPVFITRGVYNVAGTRLVGQNQEHLRLEVSDGTINSRMIGIAFNQKEFYEPLSRGEKVDICYTLEKNEFRGTISIQLHIKDIKLSTK